MLKEFKDFAMRGNVIDLAVGVVIGGAFNAIVSSLVADIFMPLIGIVLHGVNFSDYSYTIGNAKLTYGKFIQAIFVFIITAFALFILIKGVNKIKGPVEKPAPGEPPADIVLLTEIRDLLKSKH